MTELLLLAALSCPITSMVNESSEPWTKEDIRIMKTHRCGHYYPKSYCLIKWLKRKRLTYWAYCGRSR